MAMAHSKVTAQGQISIPAEVRRKLGVGPGSILEWDEEGDEVVMVGCRIADPLGIEGPPADVEGLGLLDVETTLSPTKTLRHIGGTALGAAMEGYEMHMGETSGPGIERPFARLDDGTHDWSLDEPEQA